MENKDEYQDKSLPSNENISNDFYIKVFEGALKKSEDDTNFKELRGIIISFCHGATQSSSDIMSHTDYSEFYKKYIKDSLKDIVSIISNTAPLTKPTSSTLSDELYQSLTLLDDPKEYISEPRELARITQEFGQYIDYIDEINEIKKNIKQNIEGISILSGGVGGENTGNGESYDEIKKRLHIALIVIEKEKKLLRSFLTFKIRTHETFYQLENEYDEWSNYKEKIKPLLVSNTHEKLLNQDIHTNKKELLLTQEQQALLSSYGFPVGVWSDALIENTINALDLIAKRCSKNTDKMDTIDRFNGFIQLYKEVKSPIHQKNILSALLVDKSFQIIISNSQVIKEYWKRTIQRNKTINKATKEQREIADIFDILNDKQYFEVILKKEKIKKYGDKLSFSKIKELINDLYRGARMKGGDDFINIMTDALIKNHMYDTTQGDKKKYYYMLYISTNDNDSLIITLNYGYKTVYRPITNNKSTIYTILSQWGDIKNNQIGSCITGYTNIVLFQQEYQKLSEKEGEILKKIYQVYDDPAMNFESINIIPSLLPGWSCNNLTREQVQSQLQNIYQILYDTYGDNKPTIRQVMSIDEIEKALFYAGALGNNIKYNIRYQLKIGENDILNITMIIEYTKRKQGENEQASKTFTLSHSPFLIHRFLTKLCAIEDSRSFLLLAKTQNNDYEYKKNEELLIDKWFNLNTNNNKLIEKYYQVDVGNDDDKNTSNEVSDEFLKIIDELQDMAKEKQNLGAVPIKLDEKIQTTGLSRMAIDAQLKLYMGKEYHTYVDDLKSHMSQKRGEDFLNQSIFSLSFFLSTSYLLCVKVFNPNSNEKPYVWYDFGVEITDAINQKTFYHFLTEWGRYPNNLKKTLNDFDGILWGNDNNPDQDNDIIDGDYFE